MVSVFTWPDISTWEVGRTLDRLETTPIRVVVSYAYLVFSQSPACLHQAMLTRKPFYISSMSIRGLLVDPTPNSPN